LLAAAAFSFVLVDAKLKIVRVENSPSLAIQYSGAKAARAEIRVNGVSSGIRDIKGAKTSGMVAFKIDLGLLNKGDNLIEAFIYDANGKVLGSERTTIVATSGGDAAVKVQLPKNGQTVQGTVQIQVGLGVEMKEAYVSFFVDKQFRSLKNFPPFTYYWDTTQETNGWHEVEAWTFDQSQATRKSAPVKVLINNPGGRTERQNPQEPAPKPAPKPQPKPAVQPAPKPVLKPAPQPVVQPAPAGAAWKYSSAVPAARSMTTIAPSRPTPGSAFAGIGRGLSSASGQGPHSVIVHSTGRRGVSGVAS
jgi:hypothetical protein